MVQAGQGRHDWGGTCPEAICAGYVRAADAADARAAGATGQHHPAHHLRLAGGEHSGLIMGIVGAVLSELLGLSWSTVWDPAEQLGNRRVLLQGNVPCMGHPIRA